MFPKSITVLGKNNKIIFLIVLFLLERSYHELLFYIVFTIVQAHYSLLAASLNLAQRNILPVETAITLQFSFHYHLIQCAYHQPQGSCKGASGS